MEEEKNKLESKEVHRYIYVYTVKHGVEVEL